MNAAQNTKKSSKFAQKATECSKVEKVLRVPNAIGTGLFHTTGGIKAGKSRLLSNTS